MKRDWITFFSQTGSEITNISSFYKTVPACIVHNKPNLDRVNPWITQQIRKQAVQVVQLPQKPTVEDYLSILKDFKNPLITLHGYLRIIPKEICEKYEIYNLHPGLITKYPDLKGKDPQDRAFNKQYDTAGCVIHRVIPEVDSGEIMLEHEINIKYKDLDRIYTELHALGSAMWIRFLKQYV
jgi:folate-dependent phosphoribosylglycinamide formyltransferase PurN